MENERLKTTIMVLNQRMNSQDDYEQEINIVKERNDELERLNLTSNSENVFLKGERATYVAENEKIRNEV